MYSKGEVPMQSLFYVFALLTGSKNHRGDVQSPLIFSLNSTCLLVVSDMASTL